MFFSSAFQIPVTEPTPNGRQHVHIFPDVALSCGRTFFLLLHSYNVIIFYVYGLIFPDLYVIFRYMRWSYCAKVTYNYPYFPHVRTFGTQNSGSRFMHIIQKTRRFFYTYTKCTISSQIQTFIPFSGSTCILCNDFCTQNEYRFSKNYRRASIVTVM